MRAGLGFNPAPWNGNSWIRERNKRNKHGIRSSGRKSSAIAWRLRSPVPREEAGWRLGDVTKSLYQLSDRNQRICQSGSRRQRTLLTELHSKVTVDMAGRIGTIAVPWKS